MAFLFPESQKRDAGQSVAPGWGVNFTLGRFYEHANANSGLRPSLRQRVQGTPWPDRQPR
ncbi:hypothetical protein CCP4SC76_1110002 [Gammaproteobacteria bacterium]